MEFPTRSRIEYKFGVTSGGHEKWIYDPLNSNIAHDPFGGNSVVHCRDYVDPEWSHEISGVAQGRIENVEVASQAFGDQRTVRVYLPANYRDYRRLSFVDCPRRG